MKKIIDKPEKNRYAKNIKLYTGNRGANGEVRFGCKGRQGPMPNVNALIAERAADFAAVVLGDCAQRIVLVMLTHEELLIAKSDQ